MAIIRYSALVDGITGRVGNLIFQRWRSIRYVRTYTPPRDPRSPEQCRQRSKFRDVVKAWRMLSIAAKAAWNRDALEMNMSGYNLFISRNMTRIPGPKAAAAGAPRISAVPPPLQSRIETVSPSFPVYTCPFPEVSLLTVPSGDRTFENRSHFSSKQETCLIPYPAPVAALAIRARSLTFGALTDTWCTPIGKNSARF